MDLSHSRDETCWTPLVASVMVSLAGVIVVSFSAGSTRLIVKGHLRLPELSVGMLSAPVAELPVVAQKDEMSAQLQTVQPMQVPSFWRP